MNIEFYTSLLANPQRISPEDLLGIGSIISKYPYFQSARALQLKGLKNQNSFLYNDALKVTAAYTTDRDMLFEYITSNIFIQNEIAQQIQQYDESIKEMLVISEDISEQISLEIDNQLKAELRKAEAILNPELFERKVASIEKQVAIENQVPVSKISSEENTAETILELNKPLPFTKEDTHSFSEWLQLTRSKPIERAQPDAENKTVEKQVTAIQSKIKKIEKFIKERPKIISKEREIPTLSENKNLAAPFTQTHDSLMTETLAKVYLQQNNYKKAIQAYKILILKNPEKSGFFADQIRAIEKLINTK